MATSDFPNLLLLFGPNSVTLWGGFMYMFELQAQYHARVISELKRRNAHGNVFAMMPDAEIEKKYTEYLQPEIAKLATSASIGCGSYYSNSKGKNTVLFPFCQSHYKWLTRKIDWRNYVLLEKEHMVI